MGPKSLNMCFALVQLIAALVLKPVLAKAGAELTFRLHILLMKG